MVDNNIRETLGVINTKLEYIQKDIQEIKQDHKIIRKNQLEITKLKNKTSNLALFQSGLTIIVGAVASFLGVRQ